MLDHIEIDCFGLSDRGLEREQNEDQFLIATMSRALTLDQTSLAAEDQSVLRGLPLGKLLLVADGMGGTRGGRRASQLAVDTVTRYVLNTMRWFFRLDHDHADDLLDELSAGLHRCHTAIQAEGERHEALGAMGTTLTLVYLLWPRLYLVHAGDSRCYRMRDGVLTQLTEDHSIAAKLVADGVMKQEEADDSRFSDVLWNAIDAGKDRTLTVDVGKARLQAGDTLLLCSDGLNKHVDDDHVAQVLRGAKSSEEVAQSLVMAANDGGGSDNTTVVVARFGSAQ